MKSFKSISRVLLKSLVVSSIITLAACEGDGDGPVGSITIDPTEFSWATETTDPNTCLDTYNDVVFSIFTQRADGTLQGETNLKAILTHGGNTTNTLQRVFLYEDTNNNFAIDAGEPIVNEPGDPAYSFSTDNQGQAHLNVRFMTHCFTYDGSLGIYGDRVSEFADFSVEVTEVAP